MSKFRNFTFNFNYQTLILDSPRMKVLSITDCNFSNVRILGSEELVLDGSIKTNFYEKLLNIPNLKKMTWQGDFKINKSTNLSLSMPYLKDIKTQFLEIKSNFVTISFTKLNEQYKKNKGLKLKKVLIHHTILEKTPENLSTLQSLEIFKDNFMCVYDPTSSEV